MSKTWCEVQALRGEIVDGKKKEGEVKASYVQARITSKVVACEDDPSRVGQVFTEYLYLPKNPSNCTEGQGKAMKSTIKQLKALGVRGTNPADLEGLGRIRAKGVIEPETYKGVTRDKLFVLELKPKAPSMTDDQKEKFNNLFAAQMASVPDVEENDFNAGIADEDLPAAVTVTTTKSDPSTFDDDDLPF